jgi:hypothetical protein
MSGGGANGERGVDLGPAAASGTGVRGILSGRVGVRARLDQMTNSGAGSRML